ncbi:MAG: hypothetical protein LKE88_00100 [Acidaminococcus provencensis]|jgi:hypothetical protein|uniref:DUF6414 family protein n=1 Tax=Acidaminococcus provencensis TaxID=2058289 RepID=UPI0023F3EB45|nr:hypothetical protein [Acidaminococcus provencensis]MCH4095040.1 hypothetical protein [Acidaminococcus provencensis]
MNEITTKQKTSITEKSLIDFLYVDETRVDSLISQLRDGTPRSVVKMVEDSTGSTKSGKADAKLVAAEYKSENTATKSAEENYDPFHNKIIQLLHDLSLPIQKTLNEPFSKKLVILNGTIKIRDLLNIPIRFCHVHGLFLPLCLSIRGSSYDGLPKDSYAAKQGVHSTRDSFNQSCFSPNHQCSLQGCRPTRH